MEPSGLDIAMDIQPTLLPSFSVKKYYIRINPSCWRQTTKKGRKCSLTVLVRPRTLFFPPFLSQLVCQRRPRFKQPPDARPEQPKPVRSSAAAGRWRQSSRRSRLSGHRCHATADWKENLKVLILLFFFRMFLFLKCPSVFLFYNKFVFH